MRHDEAWEIYRSSLQDGVHPSEAEPFAVDEALNFLIHEALPGEEAIMIYNQAKNYEKQGYKQLALRYYERGAIEYGDSLCCTEAGAMYFHGDGVRIDYEKAFRYLTMAYEKKWYKKADLLAAMYENGLYIEKDPAKAKEIYGHCR